MNPKDCLLCHASNHHDLLVFDQPDVYEKIVGLGPENYARSWVQCDGCGFIYSRYARPVGLIDQIYHASYRGQGLPWRTGSVEQIFERVTKLPEAESETKQRIKWIKNNIVKLAEDGLIKANQAQRKCLDIGGGTGIFAFEMQDEQWKSYVIDPDENGQFIQDKLQIPFVRDYYQPGKFGVKFDLISLIFVLEHVLHPGQFLEGVRQDMNADGLVYIEVPDAVCFKVKATDDDIFNSCHLWMFSPESLSRFLNTCGFEIFSLNRSRTKRGHMALTALAGLK